jgi:cation-transporting P-type ATPase 13A2
MTQPLFLFQYFVALIYLLESFPLFALIMISFGFVTTTINYILLLRSYRKIKETAEKLFKVQVLRDGAFIEIDNVEMVPGDVYIPCQEIPCDSIVMRGELFVDEVSLTGENVPIAKFGLGEKVHEKSHWLFEGSKLETIKEHTLAMAVHVGYGSQRGRIIRKILTKTAKQPESFKKLIIFQMEVLIVSIVVFLGTIQRMYQFDIDGIMIILRFCDFITYSFPAPYPILFNLAYSFCLMRLRESGIAGTDA